MLDFLHAVIGRFDGVIVARMILTGVLCGAVGIERSTRERASGFRPHILVGLGACLMTLAGAYGFSDLHAVSSNPLQLASYVISGIGFLGAGAILRHGTTVRGLTTAATLWGAAGIGVAVAVGLGGLAILATILVLVTLSLLKRVEARIRFGEGTHALAIHLTDDHRAVGKTLAALEQVGLPVKRATVTPGAGDSGLLQVELNRSLTTEQISQLITRLLRLRFVSRVDTTRVQVDPDEPPTEDHDDRVTSDPAMLTLDDETLFRDLDDHDDPSERAETTTTS